MTHRTSGAFCSIVVSTTTGAFDSVVSQNTAPLGDGAELFCLANRAVYRFNAGSAQATVGDIFIRPTSGGGCWEQQSAAATSFLSTEMIRGSSTFAGTNAGIPVFLTWKPYPISAGLYVSFFGPPRWTLGTSTGTFQYTGPSGLKFQVLSTTCFNYTGVTGAREYEVSITKNSQAVGSTSDDPSAVSITMNPDFDTEFVQNYIVTPTSGDFYQNIYRAGTANPGSVIFTRYQVMIFEV